MAVKTAEQRKLEELRDLCEGNLLPDQEYLYSPSNDLVIPKQDNMLRNNRHGADWHILKIAMPEEKLVEQRLLEELASEVYEHGQSKQATVAAIEGLSADVKKACRKRAFQYVLGQNLEVAKRESAATGKVKIAGNPALDMRNAFSKPDDLREARA